MKLKRIIKNLIICAAFAAALCMSAAALPLHSDASNEFSGISTLTYKPLLARTAKEDGRLKFYYNGDGTSLTSIWFTRSLGGAYKGVITLDYEVCFESGIIYAYADFPQITASGGKAQTLLTTRTDGAMFKTAAQGTVANNQYYYMNGESAAPAKFVVGTPAKFKITLDFNNARYSVRADLGQGFTDLFTGSAADPCYEWALDVTDISSAKMTFYTTGAASENVGSLTYFNVYDNEADTVYVSDNGNDENDGSYNTPFASLSRAEEENGVISLKDGVYDVSGYTFGTLAPNEEAGKEIITNANGYNASVTGEYEVLIPELDGFNINEGYKTKLKTALKERNAAANMVSRPVHISGQELKYDSTTNEIVLFANADTNSVPDTSFDAVIAVYKESALVSVSVTQAALREGKTARIILTDRLPDDFSAGAYEVRTFFVNSMNRLMPLTSAINEISPGYPMPDPVYNVYTYNSGVLSDVNCIKEGNALLITGTGSPGDMVAVVISTADGIKYVDQGVIDESGNYEKLCKFDVWYEQYTITISSTGGALDEE